VTAKKRRKPGSGPSRPRPEAASRRAGADARGAPARPQGLLGGLFGRPGAGPSSLGRILSALGRGFVAAGSSWAVLVVAFVWVLAEWAALLAMGAHTTPRFLLQSMALPPIGGGVDFQSAQALPGGKAVVAGIGLMIGRAIAVGVVAGLLIEALRGGRASLAAAVSGLRAVPFIIGVNLIGLSVLLVGGSLLAFLGAGLQFLGSVVMITALMYFLGFVAPIAVTTRFGLIDTLRRSRDQAALAGGQQFTFCLLYVVTLFLLLPLVGATNASGSLITANPSISAWIYGLLAAFVNVAFLGAFCYRSLAAETILASRPAPARRR
jgi:hypothetical protein